MRRSLVALAAAVALAGCRPRQAPSEAPAPDDAGAATVAPTRPVRIQYPAGHGSFVDVVADAAPSVVAIRATAPVKSGPAAMFPGAGEAEADVALGTGFLIEHGGVYVLTNDHVAAAAPELQVVLADGSTVRAGVVGRDPRLDLALLSIDVPRLVALPLGSSADLEVGEWVVALGNPFGDEVTASAGIVSSTGNTPGSVLGGPASLYRTYLQLDLRVHRGNTGGPVLNTAGEVVGVAVATGDRPGELSFAIPVDRVREVLDSLRDHGAVARAYLGAMVIAPPPELADRLPDRGGALVTEVQGGSPAVRAGVRPGDVILRWGDKPVDHRRLPVIVSSAIVGKKVNVGVWRDGATIELAVVPAKVPD